jgi:hypothetical protein
MFRCCNACHYTFHIPHTHTCYHHSFKPIYYCR